jgi:hypothetical protein
MEIEQASSMFALLGFLGWSECPDPPEGFEKAVMKHILMHVTVASVRLAFGLVRILFQCRDSTLDAARTRSMCWEWLGQTYAGSSWDKTNGACAGSSCDNPMLGALGDRTPAPQ